MESQGVCSRSLPFSSPHSSILWFSQASWRKLRERSRVWADQTRHPARYDPQKSNRASADSKFVWGNAEQCLRPGSLSPTVLSLHTGLSDGSPAAPWPCRLFAQRSKSSRISPCVPPASFLAGGERALAVPFPVRGERDRRLAAPLQRSQPLCPVARRVPVT